MAIVQPHKKPTLDPDIFDDFWPISKLPFLAKVLEKVVSEKFQSAFRAGHSAETALVRVLNDLLWAADCGQHAISLLLDLSTAFDTVDHRILVPSHLTLLTLVETLGHNNDEWHCILQQVVLQPWGSQTSLASVRKFRQCLLNIILEQFPQWEIFFTAEDKVLFVSCEDHIHAPLSVAVRC